MTKVIIKAADGAGAVETYHNTDKKFETTADGIQVTGKIFPSSHIDMADDVKLLIGTGDDLEVFHNGSNSYINHTTGALRVTGSPFQIKNAADDEIGLEFTEDGSVDLYFDGNKKAETVTGGFTVTGACTATSFVGDGSTLTGVVGGTPEGTAVKSTGETGGTKFLREDGDNTCSWQSIPAAIGGATGLDLNDDVKIRFGTGNDLEIYHDGTNSIIDNETGQLRIQGDLIRLMNSAGSKVALEANVDNNVELYFDNALKFATTSGGVQATGQLNFAAAADPNISLRDDGKVSFGNSDDLKIYYDSSNSFFDQADNTGNMNFRTNSKILFKNADSSENIAKFIADGACELYFDNVAKLKTISDGVRVEGDYILVHADEGTSAGIQFHADQGDDAGDRWRINANQDDNDLTFSNDTSSHGSFIDRVTLLKTGKLLVGRSNSITAGSEATDHNFEQLTDNGYAVGIHCDQSEKRGVIIYYTAGGTPTVFYGARVVDTWKFIVHGDGDCENANNSYGPVSDVSLKENIVDANSQWDDIKNIKIRNFNFKESSGHDTHTQIGVIAQELETVSPKLVKEREHGFKTVLASVLYMKAVKALQEAMAKIETLETKVAALESA